MACIIDSWVPTASITLCAPSPPVSSLILADALVAALLDDVGRAELAGEGLPVGVAAHRDDPLGAELLVRRGCRAGPTAPSPTTATVLPGPASAATAANQPVPSTSDAASSDGIRSASGCPGVATRVPSASGMRAYSAWVPIAAHRLGVHAAGLVAGLADLARVVGGEERSDDEVADLKGLHVVADLGRRRRRTRAPSGRGRPARRRGRATGPSRRCSVAVSRMTASVGSMMVGSRALRPGRLRVRA